MALRLLTAGESHGPTLSAILEGVPSGLAVDVAAVNAQLARRQAGHGRGRRQQIELDTVEFVAGVRHGRTLPGPIGLLVRNRDFENWRTRMGPEPCAEPPAQITSPRPGHADFAGALKHELSDIRDVLERSSARSTAALVAAGAIARLLLAEVGVRVLGHVVAIGATLADGFTGSDWDGLAERAEGSPVRCADGGASAAMVAAIDEAADKGDTLGGVFEVVAAGCPPGLGSHIQWDRRLESRLAAAVISIQAVKGVEIGRAFDCAARQGSEVHDEIVYTQHGYERPTNNAGGIEGGMTNGEPVVVRGAMKPLPTLRNRLRSVEMTTREAVRAHFERSDVCAVPAACVIAEAMVAFVLADAVIEKFGGDSMTALLRNHAAYVAALAERGYTGSRWSPHSFPTSP